MPKYEPYSGFDKTEIVSQLFNLSDERQAEIHYEAKLAEYDKTIIKNTTLLANLQIERDCFVEKYS